MNGIAGVLLLDRNELTGRIPSSIWSLRHLERLKLHSNNLIGTVPLLEQHALLHLREFDVKKNHLSGPLPTGFSGSLGECSCGAEIVAMTAFGGRFVLCIVTLWQETNHDSTTHPMHLCLARSIVCFCLQKHCRYPRTNSRELSRNRMVVSHHSVRYRCMTTSALLGQSPWSCVRCRADHGWNRPSR